LRPRFSRDYPLDNTATRDTEEHRTAHRSTTRRAHHTTPHSIAQHGTTQHRNRHRNVHSTAQHSTGRWGFRLVVGVSLAELCTFISPKVVEAGFVLQCTPLGAHQGISAQAEGTRALFTQGLCFDRGLLFVRGLTDFIILPLCLDMPYRRVYQLTNKNQTSRRHWYLPSYRG
jgi:hypothetical protein